MDELAPEIGDQPAIIYVDSNKAAIDLTTLSTNTQASKPQLILAKIQARVIRRLLFLTGPMKKSS